MALLTRLNPGTMYEASITSVCKEGISLPSTAVVFMTNEYTGYVSTLRPTVSTPTPPNFQACCQNEGVSDDCLFLCSAGLDVSNIDINKALLCQSHIGKVLACVADGRDHTLCCQRRDVDESCHKFCAFDHDQALSYEFTLSDATCLISFSDIMECLTTNGAESAPSPPFGLVLLNKTTHTISLQWQKPLYHAESVIGYTFSLSWGPENDKEYRRKQVALQYSTILQNLLPNTLYRVEISAFTESLTSPAVVIEARTLPG
ncbi:hypothetical protein CAPTEDRAFT_206705 [Capitella teleta]|uniref:Fibronectin type-III domain-containing protein n=1 Tax=Capitella teleta TaxID=283909 RepID=R7TH36_CAPTE|nr:hypothetical protein CAPTEDRAFT_206705 [Capitella teleta]|eukprot:ELT93019.1 hypothetical protein CAPTEDRAFT_206705 [Capitella teleta]